mmetsp:Transcript_18034/g.35600  ORF Transcript_18034/g.35600 Transcript_18034/m.35600 type:complete len:255 (-) Transcript_18034:1387-2151(-)
MVLFARACLQLIVLLALLLFRRFFLGRLFLLRFRGCGLLRVRRCQCRFLLRFCVGLHLCLQGGLRARLFSENLSHHISEVFLFFQTVATVTSAPRCLTRGLRRSEQRSAVFPRVGSRGLVERVGLDSPAQHAREQVVDGFLPVDSDERREAALFGAVGHHRRHFARLHVKRVGKVHQAVRIRPHEHVRVLSSCLSRCHQSRHLRLKRRALFGSAQKRNRTQRRTRWLAQRLPLRGSDFGDGATLTLHRRRRGRR